jgi:predicted transcriptional regulator
MNEKLSRREREILDILLMEGSATAEEVRVRLTDPPSYSTARAMLARLEAKGLIRHKEHGLRYVYSPVISQAKARRSAVDRLVRVFYEGSLSKAVSGLVDSKRLSDEDLDAIEEAIEQARQSRKKKS